VLATFVLSGLWHGASWNYVLWGLYHGVLLLMTRARRILRPAADPPVPWIPAGASPFVKAGQIVVMFALTNIGWLIFRETELRALARDLTLSPFKATAFDREAGLYLFLIALLYSVPLWVQSIWAEASGRAEPKVYGWPRLVLQGAACGLAFAAILVFRSRTSLDFIYFQF
jgi:hypothetical protein